MISTISFIGEKNFSLAETPSRGERVDVEGYRTSRGRRTWRRGGAEGIVEGGVDVGRRRGRRAEGIVEGRVAVGGRRARAGNRGGRVECASRRVARTCAGVCEFVRCACDGGVGREVSLGHARWGQCGSTLRAHLFFSVVCLAVESGSPRPTERLGSANRILASLWFFLLIIFSCIFSRTRLTRAFSVTCVEPNTKFQCQNISSCVSNTLGCR